jgi:glycerol-3-phosphate responsive antiterminator
MGDSAHSDLSAAISRTQRKIEQWRERRRPRARIPEELWRQAAELACGYGINRTARTLRLDYYSLKKRLPAAAEFSQRSPEFVEILPGGMPAGRSECLIEVEDPGGAKMRIRVQGGDLPDVAALTRAFREGRS